MKLYAIRRKSDGQWYQGVKYGSEVRYGSKPKFYIHKATAKTNFLNTGMLLRWDEKTQKYKNPHEIVTFNVSVADVEEIEQKGFQGHKTTPAV